MKIYNGFKFSWNLYTRNVEKKFNENCIQELFVNGHARFMLGPELPGGEARFPVEKPGEFAGAGKAQGRGNLGDGFFPVEQHHFGLAQFQRPVIGVGRSACEGFKKRIEMRGTVARLTGNFLHRAIFGKMLLHKPDGGEQGLLMQGGQGANGHFPGIFRCGK